MAAKLTSVTNLYSAAFWSSAPSYDSRAFWTLALSQGGEIDRYGRDLIIIGFGAAGPIRCTREYGRQRQAVAKARGIGERLARSRRGGR